MFLYERVNESARLGPLMPLTVLSAGTTFGIGWPWLVSAMHAGGQSGCATALKWPLQNPRHRQVDAMKAGDRMIATGKAAKQWGVSLRTIYQWEAAVASTKSTACPRGGSDAHRVTWRPRSGPVQPERCAVYTRVSSCKQVKPAVRFRRLPDGPLGEREGNERRKPLMDAERRRPMVALVIEEAPLVPAKMEERAVSAADAETTKHPGQHRDYPANW